MSIKNQNPKATQMRKVAHDASFKISIPIDWIRFFGIEKGQYLKLELQDDGFLVLV